MNKLRVYQVVVFVTLYVAYGFFYYTRKSVSFMLPHLGNEAVVSSSSSSLDTSLINDDITNHTLLTPMPTPTSDAPLLLTNNDIGTIISLQSLAYTISKFVGGIMSDAVSARLLLAVSLCLSGFLNINFTKDISTYGVYLLSFLVGLVQGPSWPCSCKLLRAWMPRAQLATWWSVLSTSANVSGAIGPLVATSLALKYHWTYGFMIPGLLCMSVAYLAAILLRNKPSDIGLEDMDADDRTFADLSRLFGDEDNQRVAQRKDNEKSREGEKEQDDDDEQAEDEEGEEEVDSDDLDDDDDDDDDEEEGRVATPSWWSRVRWLVASSFFVAVCVAYFLVQLVKTLFSDWSQIYFIRTVEINPFTASHFVSMFELAGIVGSIASGIMTDWMCSSSSSKTVSNGNDCSSIRMRLVRYYCVGLLAAVHVFNWHVSAATPYAVLMALASVSGFLCYGAISLLGVIAVEFVPADMSGTSHALATLAANVGAVSAGLPFGLVVQLASWTFALGVVQLLAALVTVYLFLTSRHHRVSPASVDAERKNQ